MVIEGAVPFARRVGRPIPVSAAPVGPGIDIGRFLGSRFRFLALFPGGLFRFLPCRIGANQSGKRLRSLDGALGFGAGSDKRRRFSLHEHGFFPREGVG